MRDPNVGEWVIDRGVWRKGPYMSGRKRGGGITQVWGRGGEGQRIPPLSPSPCHHREVHREVGCAMQFFSLKTSERDPLLAHPSAVSGPPPAPDRDVLSS